MECEFLQESGLFVDLFFQFDCQCACVSGHWRYFCVHGNRVYVCAVLSYHEFRSQWCSHWQARPCVFPTQTSTKQPDKRTRVGSDTERMVHESVGMEYAPKAFDDELKEPGTDFEFDIGSIHTNILTRVNEALSQTGGLGEGGDKDKCFVQQMIPAIVTSGAMAVR